MPADTSPTNKSTIFIRISLAVNMGVLSAVCTVLLAFSNTEPVLHAWGPPTAARGILLSVYFSILVVSSFLLGLHIFSTNKATSEHMIAALLVVQTLYKVTTPATAGPLNPVALSNLGICVLHAVTIYHIWQRHKS
jgi:hypothetical protein